MTTPPEPLPSEPFGQTSDGRAATLYTLQNARLRVQITDFGGRMVRIQAPDRRGQQDDVLLGFDNVQAYRTNGGAFVALLGRSANRIAGASVTIDGQRYPLSKNNGDATLHGGAAGFDKLFWTVAAAENGPTPRLVLTLTSADGDQGFPGTLTAQASYQLDDNTLSLAFEARTTKPTIVNLSAHPYFNLAGTAGVDVLNHEVTIPADAFLPTDAAQIPTGEIAPVAGTQFDFRQPTPLGRRIRLADPQLFYGLGFDHCFVLRTPRSAGLAVRLRDPQSGRVLEIHTDHPGVQIYTANKLTGAFAGHGGIIYRQSAGVALEAQAFPDAPNHAHFPSTVLRPEDTYRRVIRYQFDTT
jgi:aldose 1-epimerase